MLANIFVHADDAIQDKYLVEINSIADLQELLDEAAKTYQGNKNFCFDIMIVFNL